MNKDLELLFTEKAIEEVKTKSWGITQQFLEIHEIVLEHERPVIARIDSDNKDGTVIVYLTVKEEKFCMAIYFDVIPEVSIRSIIIEPGNTVYFRSHSDTLSLN